MAEARVVIDLIHGEESEDVNMNDQQPRHMWTSEEKASLSHVRAFLCPITMDVLQDPVVAKDGHTYSSAPLKQWLSTKDTSPITREYLANDAVHRNIALKAAMEEVAQNSVETERRLKNSDDMEKKMNKANELMSTMLDAETAKVKKLEDEMANMAEIIQTMTKERDNNDLKWKLVVDETKKKSEMEKAALVEEYQTRLDMEHSMYLKAVTDNSKLLKEKRAIQKKLVTTKNDLKKKRESMDLIAGMLNHELENEMATTNPKSNKKAKR